ncbi:hypothetical protein GAY33_11990 [Azospirillum brasilense]|uniref:hypothetical protein n=1 Tax=Azospirillum argentinense TaxID=2970906 RepID=UPI00190D008B|nr:hypothetical protein [Azospirillum argentinense]MBK3799945.1 hypothetical protein [Azospirillum argentinense]
MVGSLDGTVGHLVHNVLEAAADYEQAERDLSAAYAADPAPSAWEAAARKAKRRAAELAVAIDGLTDRAAIGLGASKTAVRTRVSILCAARPGAFERVWSAANAYKHKNLKDPRMVVASDDDVLAVGLGYGLDGFGVGKFGGVEVIVRDRAGASWKFLGDVPAVIGAWFRFLAAEGALLPDGPIMVCELQAYP